MSILILSALIASIVVASKRWPDVEKRLFGGTGLIPQDKTAEPAPTEVPDIPAEPETSRSTAKGFMKTKPLKEPDVDPAVLTKDYRAEKLSKEPEPQPARPPAPVAPVTEAVSEPVDSRGTGGAEEDVIQEIERKKQDLIQETTIGSKREREVRAAEVEPPEDTPAAPATPPTRPKAPATEAPATPGAHVTGEPARPSSPAYYDATGGAATQAVDNLASEADQAYRDRDYGRAEKACLKILMRDPKNHKYMTRIGQVYQEMGQLDDAKEAYEAAKVLDPKNFFVLNRLSEVTRLLDEKGAHAK